MLANRLRRSRCAICATDDRCCFIICVPAQHTFVLAAGGGMDYADRKCTALVFRQCKVSMLKKKPFKHPSVPLSSTTPPPTWNNRLCGQLQLFFFFQSIMVNPRPWAYQALELHGRTWLTHDLLPVSRLGQLPMRLLLRNN